MVRPPSAKSHRPRRIPGIALCAFLAASLNLCAAGVALLSDDRPETEPAVGGPVAAHDLGWSPRTLEGERCDGHVCGIRAAKRSGRSSYAVVRVTASDLAVEILAIHEAACAVFGDQMVVPAASHAPLRL